MSKRDTAELLNDIKRLTLENAKIRTWLHEKDTKIRQLQRSLTRCEKENASLANLILRLLNPE